MTTSYAPDCVDYTELLRYLEALRWGATLIIWAVVIWSLL
jgi:hypothetical protein